jgi:succinate dehydrogenase hydrophobic anchor subunit
MSRPPYRVGSRVSRLRASHSYGFVLALVLFSMGFTAFAPDGSVATCVLTLAQTLILVVALVTSGVLRVSSPPAAALLMLGAAAGVAPFVSATHALTGSLASIDALLVVGAIVAIGRGAIDQGEVNRQSLRAAISVYLLVGMFFVFAYSAFALFGSGPFFAQGFDGTTAQRFYFSFVTLATLGYGDFTPAGNGGHLLAIFEALFGQLYLVTVLALLVSNLGRKRSEQA